MKRSRVIVACALLGACNKPPPRQADAKDDARDEASGAAAGRPDAQAIVAPGLGAQLREAQRKSACVQGMSILQAVEMYRMAEGECPKSIEALVDGKYVGELPKDPWRHAFSIECKGGEASVLSPGPDGEPGTDDDVIQDGSEDACDG